MQKNQFRIGSKCFVKGEFTHVFYIADINEYGSAWLISNVNGNPYGWTDLNECHKGDHFGSTMDVIYSSLLEG